MSKQRRQAARSRRGADRALVKADDGDVFAALVELFLMADPRRCCHWNVETGERFWLRQPRRQQALREAFEERLFDEDGWIEVPWLESDDAFAMARSFVEQLEPGNVRRALQSALDGSKPFRAFRTVIAAHPGVARRWREVEIREATERLCTTALSLDIRLPGETFERVSAAIMAEDAAAEPAAESARMPSGRVALADLGLARRLPRSAD